MLSIKYPANFVSGIYALPVTEALKATEQTTDNAQITAIKDQLHLAQTHYRKSHYRLAIDAYKSAQALIHKLINPSLPLVSYLADDSLMLPVTANLELKLAEASLKLVELMQPRISLPVSPVTVTDVKMPPEINRLEAIGFHRNAGLAVNTQEKIALGMQLLNTGDTQQAIEALEGANRQIKTPTSRAENIAAGAVRLNLSSAYLLAGDYSRAKRIAMQAKRHFVVARDKLGQAQALHNEAIALERTHQLEKARQRSTEAAALYQRIAKEWRISTNNPNSTSSTPATVHLTASPALLKSLSLSLSRVIQPSNNLKDLSFIANKETSKVCLRWPGLGAGWGKVALMTPAEIKRQRQTWHLGTEAGARIATLSWKNGKRPAATKLLEMIYQPRIRARTIKDLTWRPNSDLELSLFLTHLYAFVIPQLLGDCYLALGDFTRAEQYYLQAAKYKYINKTLEVPALWARLAVTYLHWGDSLYREEHIDECQYIYTRLITRDGIAPSDSPLYALPVFAEPAADARQLIAHLHDPSSVTINPAISWPILEAWARWQNLLAGLDFFGIEFTPIFTFEYLKQVARAFAQQAINAEREYINFKTNAEAENAARRDLEGALAMAVAEENGRDQLQKAAFAEYNALAKAETLAKRRYANASDEKREYTSVGYWEYICEAIVTTYGLGAGLSRTQIRNFATRIESLDFESSERISDFAAAIAHILGGRNSYEYQLMQMENDMMELHEMEAIAKNQADAAQYRYKAAYMAWEAAVERRKLTEEALTAFDNEVFTPELWARLAQSMQRLSKEYCDVAICVAKRMERAYNFETDSNLRIIKNNYSTGNLNGLLVADYLLRDIESFTYHYIVNQRSKETQVKDVISLANEYPFKFYKFQQTGRMAFETLLYDFDRRHPGLYGQQIKGVEVEIIGLLPQEGLRGALSGGGISHYRTADGGKKSRIHAVDTLALSEYTLRNDAFVYRADERIHGLFEGHGVANIWLLNLPRRSNNLDYRLIMDVRLALYYTARYNEALEQMILDRVPLSGEMIHVRDFQLRYDFPEAWYGFLDSGQMTLTIDEGYLPRNETNFRTDKVALLLITEDGASPADVAVTLTLPDQAPVTMTTDANGEIAAQPGNALATVMGGPLLGDWTVILQPPANSSLLDDNGKLLGDLIGQVAIIVQYAFDWPE